MGAISNIAFTSLAILHLLLHNVNGCDIFQGKWVYDAKYPLYNSTDCPFIEQEFDCIKNGRKDKQYLKYRWKPTSCKLPRFDGGDFLRRFRGKRILFVGDSLSLNQWQSLTCMIHKAVPRAKYTLFRTQDLSTFKFLAYNVSLMFSRNAFLVDIKSEKIGRVLKLDSIENGKIWKGFDTLIFNTWHWWLHTGRQQPRHLSLSFSDRDVDGLFQVIRWDFIRYSTKTYKDMNRLVAYSKGLNTWARWIDSNIDPTKTKVFFQSVSPDHTNAIKWAELNAKNCNGQKQPVSGQNYPGGPHPAQIIVENVLNNMSKKSVYLLNITTLSQLRKDGHPSIYGYGGSRGMDCSHWCLAGVPDTWNQLLYVSLLQN